GSANLGGTLNINLSGYSPGPTDSFQIITYGSYTGSFNAISGLDYNPGGLYRFAIQYNPTNVTLIVVSNRSVSAPAVSSVAPGSGTAAGGTNVTITGTNFSEVNSVTFGGTAALSYIVVSSTQITANAPPKGAGTVDVQVTTIGGQSAISSLD